MSTIDERPGTLAVTLTHIVKTYDGPEPVQALRDVSLSLPTGSFTAIMGSSGSGKSTLLNCAAGLDSPTSGRVTIGAHDITTLSADALARFRREHVGFVFQAYNLIPHLTVAANIQLPATLAGRRPDESWQAELLDAVGLAGMQARRPTELSGGQAQRVAIARALFTRPTVIFADEPTGALDSRTGANVLEVLRQSARRFDQTLVVVTHDPLVASAADAVVFLADGRVADRIEHPTAQQTAACMLSTTGF